jgi:ATP-dependent RNA helicase DeaD
MPRAVVTMTRKYMNKPVELTVGTRNAGAENIQHVYYMVHAKDRYAALKRIVDFNPEIYGIIFCRTRLDTQEVAEKLMQDGYRAEALHGDLSQGQRDQIMNKFRRKQVHILVATDVAARGLDVSDLTHVINYILPDELSSYTHRSGRTGRAGKAGTSIAIIHMREKYRIRELESSLGKTFEYRRVPSGQEVCAKQLQQRLDTMLNLEIDHAMLGPMLPAITEKLATLERDELIKRFVSLNFDRFLQYYKNAPDLNERDVERRPPAPGRPREASRGKEYSRPTETSRNKEYSRPAEGSRPKRDFKDENFTRFAINVGKKDGILPARLIAIINEGTRVRNIAIGKIVISEHATMLDADSRYSAVILKAFDRQMIHGKPVKIEVIQDSKAQPAAKAGRRYIATPRPTPVPKKYKKKAAAE